MLGAYILVLVVENTGVDRSTALDLVEGWAGDAYVYYNEAEGRECLAATIEMDTSQQAGALADALTPNFASTVVDEDSISFTECV